MRHGFHDGLLAGHRDADHHTRPYAIAQLRVQTGQLHTGDIKLSADAIERLLAFHRIIHGFLHRLCLCLRQALSGCLRDPNRPAFLEGRGGEAGIGGYDVLCRHVVAYRERIERLLALDGMVGVGILLPGRGSRGGSLWDAQGSSRLDTLFTARVQPIDVIHTHAIHRSDGIDGLSTFDRVLKLLVARLLSVTHSKGKT